MSVTFGGIRGFGRVVAKGLSAMDMTVRQRTLPITVFPDDEPTGRIPGADVDRVAVIGDWNVIGLGVATYHLSLPACFARDLAARTKRGVDWSAIPVEGFRMSGVPATVTAAGEAIAGAHVAVLVLGAVESMNFSSGRVWRMELTNAIESLLGAIDPHGCLMIAAIPPLDNIGMVSHIVRRELGRQVLALNAILREVAAEFPQCVVGEFPDTLTDQPWEPESAAFRFSRVYSLWADALVQSLVLVR